MINSMDSFIGLCKSRIVKYTNDLDYVGYDIDIDSVFVVWSCKTLQNYKALLATKLHHDNRYFEITYNGDKREVYMDVYTKIQNKMFLEEEF